MKKFPKALFVMLLACMLCSLLTGCLSSLKPGTDEAELVSLPDGQLTEERAADAGGLYIRRGEGFIPLAEGVFAGTPYTTDSISVSATTSDPIPLMYDGDTLTLFSAAPVDKLLVGSELMHGYAFPLFIRDLFSDGSDPVYVDRDVLDEQEQTLRPWFTDDEWKEFTDFVTAMENGTAAIPIEGWRIVDAAGDPVDFYIDDPNTPGEAFPILKDGEQGSLWIGQLQQESIYLDGFYYINGVYHTLHLPFRMEMWYIADTGWILPVSQRAVNSRLVYEFDTSALSSGTHVIYRYAQENAYGEPVSTRAEGIRDTACFFAVNDAGFSPAAQEGTASASAEIDAAGTSASGDLDAALNDFLAAVDAGNYLNAQNIYYTRIYGNIIYEQQAEEQLEDRVSDAYEDYNNGLGTREAVELVIDTVAMVDILPDFEPSLLRSELNALEASKAAYNSGESLFAQGYYYDAYNAYMNVIWEDALYDDAQAKAQLSIDSLYDSRYWQIDELAAAGDYAGALDLIDDTEVLLGETTELATRRTEYTAKFITASLDQAAEALTSTGYEYAGVIITAAIDRVGEDPRLLSAQEEYQSYKPVYLGELDYFTKSGDILYGSPSDPTNRTDNFGNVYKNYYCNTGSATYYIAGKYNVFSGVCAVRYNRRNETNSAYFEVYGDDVLLFTSNTMTRGSEIQPFTVDITGVTHLKISYHTNGISFMATIFDGTLSKTIPVSGRAS